VWDADAFETAATVLNRGRVMSIFPEGGVHADRVPAKSGVGHIAHLAGATVVPVYLEGTRSLRGLIVSCRTSLPSAFMLKMSNTRSAPAARSLEARAGR